MDKTFKATIVDIDGVERSAIFDKVLPQEVIDHDVAGLFLAAANGSLNRAHKDGIRVSRFTLELVDVDTIEI